MRGRFRILALSTTIGSCLIATPTFADTCVESDCRPVPEAKPQQPLRLEKFRRQPVALGKPARVVKTRDGGYARVKLTHRNKPKTGDTPQFLPVVLSPEAAAALAMQASVRVVEADELNEIDLSADDPPLVLVRVTTTSEPPARVASAGDANHIDRKADKVAPAPAAPAAAPSPATAEPITGLSTWLWHYVSWLSDSLATLFAAARSLFG